MEWHLRRCNLPLSVAAKSPDNSRLISVDVNDPSILNELGSPAFCFISKINHYDDDRFHGYAMAVLAATARLKSLGTKLILLYCDNLASFLVRVEVYIGIFCDWLITV